LPIITHLRTPDPDTHILNELDDLFYHIVWNKPKGQVKRNLLKHDYSEGGRKMVDLASYIIGLKYH
jgi:hypothetical protein